MCWGITLLFGQVTILGCTSTSVNQKKLTAATGARLDPTATQMVGDLTRVWGMQSQRVDGVSLVVGLPGTGSDPPPTADREMLLAEMQRQEVDKPNSILASPTTALVHVRGFIPPGAKKGERFDIDVMAPRESGVTNLTSGWLMESRLHEYAAINGRVAEGHLLGFAQGDVLTHAVLDNAVDDVSKTRGIVLGGGVVLKNRGFGLMVKDDFASVQTSSRIGEAINARFDIYRKGQKRGVADPKRDSYVELLVHPTYQDNVVRYMRVVQNIPIRESGPKRSARLAELRAQMGQPSTAALASIKLEALGADGIPVLKDAVNSSDAETRFYAAEALAYQDEPDAVRVLGNAARREPAFRYRALAALGVMDTVAAHEELIDLMNESSAETRYGAFRVLRKQTPFDPVLGGKLVADKFYIHEVHSAGPPLIHVSRQERAEIVLFGGDHYFAEPLVLFVGKEIVVRSAEPGRATVRRLTAGEHDDQRTVSIQVADVLDAVVEFGASYADVVQALSEAKRTGALASRLEFSAIPHVGRTFSRDKIERSGDDGRPENDQEFGQEPEDVDLTDANDWLTIDPSELNKSLDDPPQTSSLDELETTDDAPPGDRGADPLENLTPIENSAASGRQLGVSHEVRAHASQDPQAGDPLPNFNTTAVIANPMSFESPAPSTLAPMSPPAACVPQQQPTLPTQFIAEHQFYRQLATLPAGGSPGIPPSALLTPTISSAPATTTQVAFVPAGAPAGYTGFATSQPVGPVAAVGASRQDPDSCITSMGTTASLPQLTAVTGAAVSVTASGGRALAPVTESTQPHGVSGILPENQRDGFAAGPPSQPQSTMPPAPERVLRGVDLLDLIDPTAPRRRF